MEKALCAPADAARRSDSTAASDAAHRTESSNSSSASTTGARSPVREELTLKAALEIAGWPSSLTAPSKQPTIVDNVEVCVRVCVQCGLCAVPDFFVHLCCAPTAFSFFVPQEFEELLLFGSHIDRILVLRDGVNVLGMDQALPADIAGAAAGETCVRRFLNRLGDDERLRELRGRIYCTPADSHDEKELKNKDGTPLDTLADKRQALRAGDQTDSVYLGELRNAKKYLHPADGRFSKSLLSRGVCDYVGSKRANAMPYWDRYDEGVFVGATYGGSPLHVDQVMWSNVGKNLLGHKLLAIWPYGEPSRPLFDEHAYSLFLPPLLDGEELALESVAQVALLCPGDVVIFHGGNAHMALSVSTALSVTAYESFVNLHPRNLDAFLESGTSAQYRQCRTRQPMLDDIKTEVSDSICDLVEDVEDGVLADEELERAAPEAIGLLRRDALIGKKVPPLRPVKKGRLES